jgi:hypothetical protein
MLLLAAGGCPGNNASLGDPCGGPGDCGGSLQCLAHVCAPRCQRAPDCGDGYSCEPSGQCQPATGQLGDACTSQVDCSAGLACQLGSAAGGGSAGGGALAGSCVAQAVGRPAGAECGSDGDCRNWTCALGHCVDLCRDTRDCAAGQSCAQVPRVEAAGAMFGGCLQSHGALRWNLPVSDPLDENVKLPVPDVARSVAVTFAVQDPTQSVGATRVVSPSGTLLVGATGNYYTDLVRHQPELGQSTLEMPSSPDVPLQPGVYTMTVASLRGPEQGTATPTATAVIKLDTSVLLDLHFYFLNLDDHPCSDAFGGTLDASIAQTSSFFQDDFLAQLSMVFAHGGIALGTTTYEDLRDHPDLDGLDVSNAGALLALGAHDGGINVFFVRTLSPVGLQAFGPNPGPAGLGGTPQSGIVIGVDTLCYRSWPELARLAAHELARYMGLYDNVEIDYGLDMTHVDPIGDSDTSSSNLMFYSELGGGDLSAGQRDVLARSPVLR